MKYLLVVIAALLAAPAFSADLDGWMNIETGGDSLSPAGGRLDLGGMLTGDDWQLVLQERYSGLDTTGQVKRFLGSYSRTDIDFSVKVGILTINPDLVYAVDVGDFEPEVVLPRQAGVAYRQGYIRPGLALEAQVAEDVKLFARGIYWNRDILQEDDYDLAWTDTRISGGVTWDAPLNTSLTIAGLTHNTTSDFIGYDKSWNRYDVKVALHPGSLPRNMYFSGDVSYSAYSGTDYNDRDIADRLTSRVRLVQLGLIPAVSVNTEFESVIDFDGGTARTACTSLESRLIWKFFRDREVTSAVILSGKTTRSSISTDQAELFSRLNIYRGFSFLANASARVTPTTVAGAGPDRQRYTFGPGLEYQFGNKVRIWGIIEQERTNLEQNENWWRIRSGLELYPGSISI